MFVHSFAEKRDVRRQRDVTGNLLPNKLESIVGGPGERQKRTEWHKIVVWGKQAEIAQQYLKKGSLIFIEGRIQSREWQDKEGQKRTSFEIVANNFRMLGGRAATAAKVSAVNPTIFFLSTVNSFIRQIEMEKLGWLGLIVNSVYSWHGSICFFARISLLLPRVLSSRSQGEFHVCQ